MSELAALLREARALGFETKGPAMTAKTTKKTAKKTAKTTTKKTAKKAAKAKPAARKRSVNFGEAEFTIHCLRDLVQMKIEAGIVAEARVTKDLYQELFDHAKARILAVSRS
ncbi:MAG: hypothetical protein JNL79_15000 [Myxococcales bacterium]|nr:hypothetical protein [Myxococcales bacterium]